MRIISVPKEFIYVAKHKPIALSAAADGRMQKLRLWRVLKDKQIGEDEERRSLEEIQKLTDRTIAEIDSLVSGKEADIMAV